MAKRFFSVLTSYSLPHSGLRLVAANLCGHRSLNAAVDAIYAPLQNSGFGEGEGLRAGFG